MQQESPIHITYTPPHHNPSLRQRESPIWKDSTVNKLESRAAEVELGLGLGLWLGLGSGLWLGLGLGPKLVTQVRDLASPSRTSI